MARIVLVTGCSTGGIGYALCKEFARQGCKVYATSRKVETIEDFRDSTIEKLALDVTSDDSIQRAIQHVLNAEGQIDVVVNNAGRICAGPLIDQSLEDVQRVFDTNTFAILRMAKAVIPVMAKRGTGLIINMGSVVGEFPTAWNGIYSASKAAVQSFSEVLSSECRPFNISVLHVSPGAVKSNIAGNGAAHFKLHPDTLYASFLPNIMQRINASQGSNTMPADVFARKVVSKALRKHPPAYMMLGGQSWLFTSFKWLPRAWVLLLLWKIYSKKISS